LLIEIIIDLATNSIELPPIWWARRHVELVGRRHCHLLSLSSRHSIGLIAKAVLTRPYLVLVVYFFVWRLHHHLASIAQCSTSRRRPHAKRNTSRMLRHLLSIIHCVLHLWGHLMDIWV